MLTTQELMEAVASYQPIAPATFRGWQYGIKGFETKPVDDIDKRFVNLRRSQLNSKGYKPSYVRTLLGYCGTSGRLPMNKWNLLMVILGVGHSKD